MPATGTTPLHPLQFHPLYKEKVWGGRTLQTLGRTLPGHAATPIGESWEIADLAQSSVSGGGGGAERSSVAQGPFQGMTLRALIQAYGEKLLGRLPLTPAGNFPLLVKYLDARENLSVQVHPSPEYARTHADAFLKSEAWYIVAAAPGAVIYKGVKAGVTPAQLRAALLQNTDAAVLPLLITVPVKAGDCHYLPSGTCHALGAGILVAEVQTPSDTTFRVYDWGRQGRELHIEQALQCIQFGPPRTAHHEQRTHIAGVHTSVSRLVACEHFRIEKVRMSESYEQEVPYHQPVIWMVLEGQGTLTTAHAAPVTFRRGDTLLLPATLPDAKVKLDADTSWLEVTFPQTGTSQIA
jgi:mannose-6-phosphate isomerase